MLTTLYPISNQARAHAHTEKTLLSGRGEPRQWKAPVNQMNHHKIKLVWQEQPCTCRKKEIQAFSLLHNHQKQSMALVTLYPDINHTHTNPVKWKGWTLTISGCTD